MEALFSIRELETLGRLGYIHGISLWPFEKLDAYQTSI